MVAILSIPFVVWAFTPPPAGQDGNALTGTTCGVGGGCHAALTPGNVAAAFSGGATVSGATGTYTPNSTVPITVTLGTGGTFTFEMSAITGTAQAGSFNPGTGLQVVMGTTTADSGIQYIENTSHSSSYTFTWTAPASGTVIFNLAGATGQGNAYSTSYTLTPAAGGGGGTTTLDVNGSTNPTALAFNATAPGADPSTQPVMVTATGASTAVTFNAVPSTTSGGNWLTVGGSTGTATGTTPVSESIGVMTAGLTPGTTYNGSVQFSASGVSTVTLNVSLTIAPTTGGGGGQTYSFAVVDRLSGGADYLFLEGSGDATNPGSGRFERFRSMTTSSGRERTGTTTTTTTAIVSSGTWKTTTVTSSTSSKQVLQVQLTTANSSSSSGTSTGTLTINTGASSSNATLALPGGVCFNSVGIGIFNGNPVGTGSCSTSGGTTGGGTPPDE